MKHHPVNAQLYRETSIKTASPLKLVVMLYDEAIHQIEAATKLFESGVKKYDAVNNAIGKAQDIITELMVSLDMEQGEIAQNLFRLYAYANRVLSNTNIQKKYDTELSVVVEILKDLRESWVAIAENPPSLNQTNPTGGIDIAG